MKIKSYHQFEGVGSFIRRKFNKDEITAEGIYKKILLLTKDDIIHDDEFSLQTYLHDSYKINIDDFSIEVSSAVAIDGRDYSISIDGAKLDASNTICKKVFNKIDSIYKEENNKRNRQQEEDKEYTKKDARIHFSKE